MQIVRTKFARLQLRYGRRFAIAILVALILGFCVPLPGSSFITAAPVVAVAELHRVWKRGPSNSVRML